MSRKTRSIAEQAQQGIASLDKWAKGESRFRVTMATRDGKRTTFRATRDELRQIRRADGAKRPEPASGEGK